MKSKVELLSPAGDFEGLVGAINAGADAVYLGGKRFSARAYAGNFENETLIRVLNLAHLFKRNIYLTINTLIKEKEFGELYDYLCPLYEAGLHAVIIQDVGVLRFIKANFPGLAIHASTQMNVTHPYAADFLRKNGVKRIIPARELTINELMDIRKNVDVELETFVHGAMCYSYSGRCLYSSILGGRSGNRGRCAQPCRLPYNNSYPLSLKDMCTIDILPDLIEAGINAFKIEGRMKKPEYTAGVTAMYRKHIDMYYGNETYQVSNEDRKLLKSLYIRDETGRGYYFPDKNTSMITRVKPSYNKTDEGLLKSINNLYIKPALTKVVNGRVSLFPGREVYLELECDGIKVHSTGVMVQEAKTQPILTESVNKQMRKTGDSVFTFNELVIEVADNAFIPVGELNELRREGLRLLEDRMLEGVRRKSRDCFANPPAEVSLALTSRQIHKKSLHTLVTTTDQWLIICETTCPRIYANIDLWNNPPSTKTGEWYANLPSIIRTSDSITWTTYERIINNLLCDGVLISNFESYEWLKCISYQKPIVLDSSLYIWNNEAKLFWLEHGINEFYLPQELNRFELNEIISGQYNHSLCVYGRIPMMLTAQHTPDLIDRMGKQFPVYHTPHSCYNIIYNSVPLSLHDFILSNKLNRINTFRLDFTTETGIEAKQIFSYFDGLLKGNDSDRTYQDFTTGHIKRGVQ